MDIIQLLPDSVANQIAAGEVIQRPASVIKELVENSVDAGAKTIKVLVVDAGKTSVQVIDDGCGMSDTDARLSFERHATSKIRRADDLFKLHTMGFRGEALASIAAVSQVTVQTRQEQEELGTKLCISGSRVVSQEPVACAKGTNFLIENLFFNVPVRRKFLKSNSTEMRHVTEAFERIVLVYPDIHFVLYNNGQEMLNLRAGSLHQRILDVFGKKINQNLLPVEANTTLCGIKGFVGKPESARQNGVRQFFFVNGRYMEHPYFRKAIMMAFDRLIPAGDKVHYFIYFQVAPEDIDVNIHPVKTEIKFENEQAIWQILLAAVRDAVGKFSGVTKIDFDTEGKPDIPVYNPEAGDGVQAPTVDFNPNYNPFDDVDVDVKMPRYLDANGRKSSGRVSASLGLPKDKNMRVDDWQKLYQDILKDNNTEELGFHDEGFFQSSLDETDNAESEMILNRSHEHYQYKGTYIVTQVPAGLLFVDQHRADVRILFEEYMKMLANRSSHIQKVLFPEVVQFPPSYVPHLDAIIDRMCQFGFDITNVGGGSYAVAGVPAAVSGLDPVTLVTELVSAAVEFGSDVVEEMNALLAQELAVRSATPYGEVLSQEDMETKIEKLFSCSSYKYTPDGKVVMTILDNSEIISKF